VQARRLRSSLFDTTKLAYQEVFPDEPRTPYEYLVPCLLLTYVEKRIRSILKEVAGHAQTELDDEEREQDEIKASVRYAKWFIVGILGWLAKRHYGSNASYPALAKALYPSIGDFTSPSEFGKHMLDFAFNVIEEYSDEETRRDQDEEEQKREEFDPALAYRQDRTWNNLKRKSARNYKRENQDGRFRGDLFPKLS
jgi:REP element-mobilizing transposase RayT